LPRPTFEPRGGVPIGLLEPARCLLDRVNTLLDDGLSGNKKLLKAYKRRAFSMGKEISTTHSSSIFNQSFWRYEHA